MTAKAWYHHVNLSLERVEHKTLRVEHYYQTYRVTATKENLVNSRSKQNGGSTSLFRFPGQQNLVSGTVYKPSTCSSDSLFVEFLFDQYMWFFIQCMWFFIQYKVMLFEKKGLCWVWKGSIDQLSIPLRTTPQFKTLAPVWLSEHNNSAARILLSLTPYCKQILT